MPNLAKKITKAQAKARTEKHKSDLKHALKLTARLSQEVSRSLDLGVPEALGLTVQKWLMSTFKISYQHLRRGVRNYRALKKLPIDILDEISDSNATLMRTKLSEEERMRPGIVGKARTQKPAQFRETVQKMQLKKGEMEAPTKETWGTYAVRMPLSVLSATLESDEKIARVLQVDMSEELRQGDLRAWTGNRVKVMEAKAVLINLTDESRLKVEIEGESGPVESLAVEQDKEAQMGGFDGYDESAFSEAQEG